MEKKPFEGINIIDLGHAGVGSFIVKFLGQYGPTMVRVESSQHPDSARTRVPFAPTYPQGEWPGLERSFQFASAHPFPEYGMTLDLKKSKAVEIFKKLVKWCDVIIENFAPGQMEKWGLGYDELKIIKPDIILLSSSGYGQTGPLSRLAAFGQQLTAIAGMDEIAGWPDRQPVPLGTYYTDVLAPMYGAAAVITALDYRRRTGKGQHIDHCQIESAIGYLAPLILDYSANKRINERTGNQIAHAAPHGVFRCKGDDRWVAIAVFTDKEWKRFCEIIENPDWTKSARFSTSGSRVENRDELDNLVNEWTINYTPEQVMEKLQAAGVAAGKVSDGKDLYEDNHLNAINHFRELDHPYIGRQWLYHPSAFTLSEAQVNIAAPVLLGEHTEYVATKIVGLSDKEFVQLMQEGVFE